MAGRTENTSPIVDQAAPTNTTTEESSEETVQSAQAAAAVQVLLLCADIGRRFVSQPAWAPLQGSYMVRGYCADFRRAWQPGRARDLIPTDY